MLTRARYAPSGLCLLRDSQPLLVRAAEARGSRLRIPSEGRARRSATRCSPAAPTAGDRDHAQLVGWDFEVILIVPAWMSDLILSSSDFRSAGTLESKSWNGASPVPWFSSVPTNGVLEKLPS